MNKFIFILVISITISVCHGAWFDNNTRYRLEVTSNKTGKTFFVELENKIFPASLTNGVSVYTAKGKSVPFYFSRDRNKLFIHSPTGENEFHIYFGFNKRQAFNKWQKDLAKAPQENPLELTAKRIKLYNERFYTVNNEGLQKLAFYSFNPPSYIKDLQKQNLKMDEIRREIRKKDRERGKSQGRIKDELKEEKETLEKKVEELRKKFGEKETKLSKDERDAQHYRRIMPSKVLNKTVSEIYLKNFKNVKIKKHEMLGIRINGQLFIDKVGEYEFAVNSQDSSLLTIDNKVVVGWPGKHSESNNWENSGKVKLQPGLHQLCFYYFRRGKESFAEAAWKKPGEKNFRRLKAKDFLPAFPSKIVNCANKEGQSFPIINFALYGYFMLDGDKKADWINCWVDDEKSKGLKWMSDGTLVSNTKSSSFLPIRGENSNLYLSSQKGKFNDIPIKITNAKLNKNRFDPDIELKIWTPSFIYDKEILDMDFEMVSGLSRESNILFKTTLSRPVCFLQDSTRFVKLAGKQAYDKNSRFCPPSRQKESIEIVGPELKKGLNISFYLMIPPVIFSKHSIRFIPISECAGIIETVDGLVDQKGQRVIPILHRPDLAEKRVWSLSKAIINELAAPKKLLVIADDFGLNGKSFQEQLKKRLEAKNVKLEFIPWKQQKFGSTLKGSIGELIPVIKKTAADRILIIPPARDTDVGIPVRTQTRALAALIQIAQNNKNIRVIYASSPFPSLRKTKLDNELTSSIKKLAEEYNVEFFDMNAFIRNKPNWRHTYRFDEKNDLLYEPYPLHSTEEISQKIFDSL